jgi:predicted NBD/HSP70 family sugar kinase
MSKPNPKVDQVLPALPAVAAGLNEGAIGPGGTTSGAIFQLIRSSRVTTRSDLLRLTGLGRSTILQRLEPLVEVGLIEERGGGISTGGRPPVRLGFRADAGVVLVADLGASHARLAVTDLAGTVLRDEAAEHSIADGPGATADWMLATFAKLLKASKRPENAVWGVGVGVPGPVEFSAGRVVRPPIMPGWDGVVIPDLVQARFPVPVLVDNDVNIMAVGEYGGWRDEVDDFLFIKVGTGIGCGVVLNGRIHRGAQGAAGDLGHIRVADHGTCHCGNVGCVEAVASGDALAAGLRAAGFDVADSRDVVRLVREADSKATSLVRTAGRYLGEVVAAAVSMFNPSVVVVGGDVAMAHERFLAGVREVVYQRSTPLATRFLRISESRLGDRAGIIGAAAMVLDQILSAAAVDRMIATHESA